MPSKSLPANPAPLTPTTASTNDTYFNSIYDPDSDYLITIPPNWADANYSDGQGKVDALLQTFMPNCQLPVLLVNDPTDGGSDGFYKTAIASTEAFATRCHRIRPDILTHETGHVLANLSDEYTYTNPYAGAPRHGGAEHHAANESHADQMERVDFHQHARSHAGYRLATVSLGCLRAPSTTRTNWYRPELNCAMGALGVPFCSVCSEALVLAIYQRVRPVDGFSPASTNFSVTTTQALAFSLALLQPATHNLSVQWFTNGVPWTGATNLSFTLLPQSLRQWHQLGQRRGQGQHLAGAQ